MNQEQKEQSLAVFDRARAEVVANGQINRVALRSALPGMSEFQFQMCWCTFRRRLRKETGYRLRPVPKSNGVYRLDTAEEGIDRATNGERKKVVSQAERHYEALVDLQRRPDLTDDTRQRCSHEETVASRNLALVRRAYLHSQRKRPDGLGEVGSD